MFKKEKQESHDDAPVAIETAVTPVDVSGHGSVIGPTLTFRGEISADEDLVIEGTIEGSIAHHTHGLTIGKEGRVKADIHARLIAVEGTMEGDLCGDEAVILRSTARVSGNIVSPRVVVEDGAIFTGSITMGERAIAANSDTASAPDIREAV